MSLPSFTSLLLFGRYKKSYLGGSRMQAVLEREREKGSYWEAPLVKGYAQAL